MRFLFPHHDIERIKTNQNFHIHSLSLRLCFSIFFFFLHMQKHHDLQNLHPKVKKVRKTIPNMFLHGDKERKKERKRELRAHNPMPCPSYTLASMWKWEDRIMICLRYQRTYLSTLVGSLSMPLHWVLLCIF